jgi:type I restriction enzyme S subunit
MNTPKIRFKGFKDDWEQRKVQDVADRFDNLRIPVAANLRVHGTTPYYGANGIQDYVEGFTHDGEFVLVAEDGANDLKNYPVKCVNGRIWVNNHAHVLQGKAGISDNSFLAFAISQSDIESLLVGGSRAKLNAETLMSIEFKLPCLQEQYRIGEYLTQLDHLITLHQRKCDETKQLKKFMLQKMFPKNGEKNPEIRFEGFTDAWEQRKLDTVAKFSKGSGYSKGDLIETGTPIILYGRLYTKYETSISDVDTYVEAKEGSVYSKGGEVIVPASGETAEDIARAATVDKSGILLGGDLNVVMPNEDINSAFLAISISNGNSQRELAKKAQGKSVVHIHNEEIRNLIVPFPIKAEQNRIVDYFSTLDHLITLHQRKCEKLKALKKFMLQNMFI